MTVAAVNLADPKLRMQKHLRSFYYINVCVSAYATIAVSAGCTALSLERHTVNQAASITDLRYQEVINNLAVVANNRGTLPSFSLFATGNTQLSDLWGIDSNSTWDRAVRGFSKQVLGLSLTHSPDQSWTLDPVVSQPQLDALRAAFSWPIYGPPASGSNDMEILRAPYWMETTGYHFDIAQQLAALPPGWIHVGSRADVPKSAAYKGHCGRTYVWVNSGELPELSEFTLIVLDLCTVDVNALRFKSASVTAKRSVSGVAVTELWKASQDAPTTDACRHVCAVGNITVTPAGKPVIPPIGDYKRTATGANLLEDNVANSRPTVAPAPQPSPQTAPRQVQSSQLQ